MNTVFRFAFHVVSLPFGLGQRSLPPRGTVERPTWRRRWLMVLTGLLPLVAGISLVAYGMYSAVDREPEGDPGSSLAVVSFTDATGGSYARPGLATSTPEPSPTPSPGPAVPPPSLESAYRMRIPKAGVDAGVVTYGLDANNVPEVPYNGSDVAWYDFSAKPGAGSNAVFAGHVTWNGHAVFWDLDKMEPGDDIYLEGRDGTTITYEVAEVFLVDASDPDAVSVMGPTQSDTITLITCGGDYFYVGGIAQYDYTHRLIVRAALKGIEVANAAAGADGEPASGG